MGYTYSYHGIGDKRSISGFSRFKGSITGLLKELVGEHPDIKEWTIEEEGKSYCDKKILQYKGDGVLII